MTNRQDVKVAHDQLILLGNITLKFADIRRAVLYRNGHHENDAEHSFHLAISATELAANYHPELDVGLVSQFSIVHDLVEIYAGDVPSWKMDNKTRVNKEKAEKAAAERLIKELPPHTAELLKRYEEQVEPEARFVRLVDKLLPAVIHAVSSKANKEEFFTRYEVNGVEDLEDEDGKYMNTLKLMFPEFDFLLLVRAAVAQTSISGFFPDKQNRKY